MTTNDRASDTRVVKNAKQRVRGANDDTSQRLVRAAAAEFARHGFLGTDSNKIARAAGFAPQTFYRWFADKTAIFVAVYRAWEEDERALLDSLLAERASARKIADGIVSHHRQHLVFRRSLRQLAVQDEIVRKARAQSRRRQLEHIRARAGRSAQRESALAVLLLQVERLADALAEGELTDLGLDEAPARRALAQLIGQLSAKPRSAQR